jgi:outer membrane protein
MKRSLTSIVIGLLAATSSYYAQADDLLTTYQQALKNDPVTLKAQAQFHSTKEAIKQTRAILLPQITANASISDSKNDIYLEDSNSVIERETDNTSITARLNMELYHHDSWLRLDNAKKSAHQSDITYQLSKQDLIVRVSQAYFDVLRAQDTLEFALAEKKAIARQLEQTKQRFDVGLTAVTDVHEAQAEYDNAVTAEIRAENQVYNSEEILREITNIYPGKLSTLNTKRFSASRPAPTSANEWQQTAEAKNLTLISQKISLDIAKENINIARSGHYPTLDLTGAYGKSEDNVNDFDQPKLDNRSIGITLSVPIYSGGAVSSSVKQAQSNYVAASQDLTQSHRKVVRTTRNAYNTVIAAVSAIKSLEQSVISADSALKATEAGFDVGTRTIVDVLNSTRNLYNAKRNLSSTRYDYILAILALKQAGGTISEQDVKDINAGLTAG